MECTRYTSAREILRNSTFLRHAAKCERAICKQLHPLKIAVIRNSPASRQTAWCWASFMLRFGAFLRIKSPMCRSFFYAVLTYCALPITVTARSWSKNEHFSLYREKAREEKEGERRLWERCVNRLRFSTVSIAAAREKRERWLSRSGGLPPLFCSTFSP